MEGKPIVIDNLKTKLSFLNSLKFLRIFAAFSALIIILLLVYSQNLANSCEHCCSCQEKVPLSQSGQPTPTLTPKPVIKKSGCLAERGVIFSQDKDNMFAACLENNEFQVHKLTAHGNYESFGKELTKFEDGDFLYLAYASFTDSDNVQSGARVFKIDLVNKTLDNILDPLDVPNPKLFMRGKGVKYTPVFWLFEKKHEWVFSPDKAYILLKMTDCSGCSTTTHLYAYNFKNDKLTYIGVPYPDYSEETYQVEGYFIEWLDNKTIKWKEGETRATGDYMAPFETVDLGYRITNL